MATKPFFSDGDVVDIGYRNVRAAEVDHLRWAREQCEALWEIYEPYADAEFLIEVRRNFDARFWEMYLTTFLIKEGYKVICPCPQSHSPRRDTSSGDQLMQQFQPLRRYLHVGLGDARDVAARTVKAGDEAEPDRIGRRFEDDRNGHSRGPGSMECISPPLTTVRRRRRATRDPRFNRR
jgi:hypothetical protein